MSGVCSARTECAPYQSGRIYQTLQRAIGAALIVRERLNLWEWSDRFITIDARYSARPGKYESAYTFYMRGVMEALSDRRVRQVTVVKGAQIAFTTVLANWVMYLVDMDPGPTMLAQPSRRMMRRYVKKELHDRFIKTPRLTKYLPSNRREKFTTEEMYFTSMDFFATGVGSPALVSSLPIKNVAADEVDKWRTENEIEAGTLDLLEVRLLTYKAQGTSKFVVGSTPTLPEMTVSVEAAKGSQERYWQACQYCNHQQEVRFENFDWRTIKNVKHRDGSYDLDRVEKYTTLECEKCHTRIPNESKWKMQREGLWVPQNERAPDDHRSFYVTGELSVALTFGMLARKFLETQFLPGGLHNFYNSYLGRAWERKAGGATRKTITLVQEASPAYELGNPQEKDAELILTFRPIAITMQVDVQQEKFVWTMRAWMVDGSRAVIACGECVSYSELVDLSNRKWKYYFSSTEGSSADSLGPDLHRFTDLVPEEYDVWTGLMDSGYKTKSTTGVYNFIHEQGGRWIATKGGKFAGKDLPISETTVLHAYEGLQVEIPLIHYNDNQMKEWLYRFVLRERRQPPYWLPRSLPHDYVEQHLMERLVPKKMEDGRTEMRWKSEGGSPDYADCEKIGELFHFILNPDLRNQIRAKQDADRESVEALKR